MHILYIICMTAYCAYFAYFAYEAVNIFFCNFVAKKRHSQIKLQKEKLPAMYNIIHYQSSTPL